jgi:hypothetical protein
MATKSILKKYYYSFIRDVNPFYTDHGFNHIVRIFERLFDLLKPHLLTDDDDEVIMPQSRKSINSDKLSTKINAYDLYLLMCSVLWHDIGNLYGRKEHEKKIFKLFDKAKDFLHDKNSADWIEKIGKAHSGNKAIDNIERETLNMEVFTYHPKFLAALLRFADELDEDKRRISEKIESIPEESEAFWFFCKCNESIKVEPTDEDHKKSIIVVEARIESVDIYHKFGKAVIDGKKEKVFGIEEYIRRIQKICKEMLYCGTYMKPYHFRAPDQLELRLRICEGADCLNDINANFNALNGYDSFFEMHNSVLEQFKR